MNIYAKENDIDLVDFIKLGKILKWGICSKINKIMKTFFKKLKKVLKEN